MVQTFNVQGVGDVFHEPGEPQKMLGMPLTAFEIMRTLGTPSLREVVPREVWLHVFHPSEVVVYALNSGQPSEVVLVRGADLGRPKQGISGTSRTESHYLAEETRKSISELVRRGDISAHVTSLDSNGMLELAHRQATLEWLFGKDVAETLPASFVVTGLKREYLLGRSAEPFARRINVGQTHVALGLGGYLGTPGTLYHAKQVAPVF